MNVITNHPMFLEKYLFDTKVAPEALNAASTSAEFRAEVARELRALSESLEGPEACIWRVVWGPQANAALRVAFEMRLFDHFDPNSKERTVEELAQSIGAEPLLLSRIMRALNVVGIFTETGENRYAHNDASMKLTDKQFRILVTGLSDNFSRYMPQLPSYLSSLSFTNPTDSQNTLFNYATNYSGTFFEWLQSNPSELNSFTAAMAASSALNRNNVISTVSSLFPPSTTADILLVDIGSGRGLILDEVRTQRLDLIGRMIAQDLQHEIAGRPPNPGAVEAMAYDFFTPQPVKGAHTYYLRHVLHDWPDAACKAILRNTVEAMRKGYSRVVVVDAVLPNTGVGLFAALLDVNMMALGGIERTERHWKELLESVGLKVVVVKTAVGGRDGLIEAVAAE